MSNNLKKKRKNSYIDKQCLSTSSLYLLFPLFLMVTVLPLIVSMHSYSTGLGSYDWFPADDTAYDFFLYYKQWFFVLLAGICLLILIVKCVQEKKLLKFHMAFAPLIGYAVLAVLSTLFSDYRIFGFTGIYEQFENIFCLLGYILVAYYAFLIIQSEQEIRLLINALALGALILGIIGSFQAIGLDFFNSSFGKSLIVERNIDPESLTMAFEKGRVYSSLYNPNYVGVYAAMIIPIFTILLLYSCKISEYILYSLVILTQVICMLGAQSKTGLISIAVSVLVAIILLRRILIRRWYIVVPLCTCAIIAFIAINIANDNAYLNAIKNSFTSSEEAVKPRLTDIEIIQDTIKVTYKDNSLLVSRTPNKELEFHDEEGNLIKHEIVSQNENGYMIIFSDPRYELIYPIIYTDDVADLNLLIDDTNWYFSFNDETNQFVHYNRNNKYSPIENAPSSLFEGKENFASGRGYIWSRTLPLLSDHIILGSGADSFAFVFPQYDYVNMYNYGFGTQLITKPHSLYLQIGVQTGVISLLCFIAFYFIYFVQSIMIYLRKKEFTTLDALGIAIFVGSVSYMISGFSNDSSITIAPVFWVMIGLGLVANKLSKTASNS